MTSLPQVSPRALKPGTNSADGPIGPTHGSFATVCRLYSRIAGYPTGERTGAVASSQTASVRSNSNAPDGPARVSERGVGGSSCPISATHAGFNPEADPMARADRIREREQERERMEFRQQLSLTVMVFVIAVVACLAVFAPYHPEVKIPVSCFSMGC